MVSRLLLGCGEVGRTLAETLREREGDLTVLAGDESHVEAMREEGLPARACDVADPAVLREYDPDVVFVGTDEAATAEAAVRAVREVHPDVHLVVYGDDEEPLSSLADRVVDPGGIVVERVRELVEGRADDDFTGVNVRGFRETLRSLPEPLAVVMHDNPDPDAIGSGVALERFATVCGLEASTCYFGSINHQENRAMVNLLELDLRNLADPAELSEFESIALVDHSRPGVNDQLPVETDVDVVVDHHPPRGPIDAGFVDLREDYGATSTIVVDYYERLGVDLAPDVATALLYGIRVDTDDFAREASPVDFRAAATLLEHADLDVLSKVESPSVSTDTMETIAHTIRNRRVEGSVVVSYAGHIADRDALAQAADMLLGLENATAVLAFGTLDETVYASARAQGADYDLGETLRAAFGRIGSAGGHAEMAGAQIPLGSLAKLPAADDAELESAVEGVIAERFLETIRDRPRVPVDLPVDHPRGERFPDEGG